MENAMNKVTSSVSEMRVVDIADMPFGSFGIRLKDGEFFYRTGESAVCLDCPGKSFSSVVGAKDNVSDRFKVRLLPPGTVITIVVGKN